VHALAGQRVEVGRQHTGQGLALTGLHLGDVAEVQRRATHHLDVVVSLAEHPLGGFAGRRERLGQEVVERLALLVTLLVLIGQLTQLGVGQLGVIVLDRVDGGGDRGQATQNASLAGAEDLFEDRHG
jgi:hypothetical protein